MDEDEFVSILKDCWEGRRYQCPEAAWVIEIVEDVDGLVYYDLVSSGSPIISGSTRKVDFKDYLIRHSFIRVKNISNFS